MSEHPDQIATLIKMANQIAANLSAYSPDEASTRIAQHLTRFWAPKMRKQLFVAATDNTDVSPLVQDALQKMQEQQSAQKSA